MLPRPKGSFNQPVTPPLSEPTAAPFAAVCFSSDWLPLVMGCLDQLLLRYTWKGTDNEVDNAINRAQSLKDTFAESICANETVPTPYWESASDSDDEATPSEQTWYGFTSGSFVEDVADWVITGFIAAGINPHAAVVYKTYVPRMRLAFRTSDIGALVRITVDGVKAMEFSTESTTPDIIEVPLVIDATAETLPTQATIMIESV